MGFIRIFRRFLGFFFFLEFLGFLEFFGNFWNFFGFEAKRTGFFLAIYPSEQKRSVMLKMRVLQKRPVLHKMPFHPKEAFSSKIGLSTLVYGKIVISMHLSCLVVVPFCFDGEVEIRFKVTQLIYLITSCYEHIVTNIVYTNQDQYRILHIFLIYCPVGHCKKIPIP